MLARGHLPSVFQGFRGISLAQRAWLALTNLLQGPVPLNHEFRSHCQSQILRFFRQTNRSFNRRSEDEIRAWRKEKGLLPSYRLVDTCAAEFEAYTPYFYSTYDRGDDEIRPSEKRKVMILGGGPIALAKGSSLIIARARLLRPQGGGDRDLDGQFQPRDRLDGL